MVGEDYRSRAVENYDLISELRINLKKFKKQVKNLEAESLKKDGKLYRNK